MRDKASSHLLYIRREDPKYVLIRVVFYNLKTIKRQKVENFMFEKESKTALVSPICHLKQKRLSTKS